ncbi:hypothetical protein I6U48_16050 [Clostridium sp. PL3]|uniref:Uncharacterized protein n=1 Tax=Clostridium thailandense TaxID=2794346 RepID=A0A949TLA3_9CLOT|nr:hypothetical protein [Clostridium thailandense]MBV7274410.1 hypothetical protein [Clostridium thailandense]
MDIKIGGTNDSAYESLKAKNSQKNAQKTDTQETVEKDNKSMKSANNIDLAAKYVSSQGDTIEISREGASALESSKIKNSQTNVQETNNPQKAEKSQEDVTSINNTDLATKYVSSQGDTVEISKEGASALESSKANTSENASKSTDEDSSSNESTTNLSQYTDSELKELYAKGKISASQYNSELANRGQDSSNIDTSLEK